MELNYRDRIARVTIVYYGPAAGGKTTNLQVLHSLARHDHRGDLVSVNSTQGRTILFDLLPLVGLGLAGWELKLRLLAVPGQSSYAAARRLTIRGADAIVFVANSASDRWYENPASMKELTDNLNLHEIDPRALPTVLQYNKRDLPEIMPIEAMNQGLNPRMLATVPAVATSGDGVRETLATIARLVVEDVGRKYGSLALPAGVSSEQWTQEGLLRVFGPQGAPGPLVPVPVAPSGSASTDADAGHRVVRINVQQPQGEAPGDAQAEGRLVESYVQASVALGQTVEDLRQQRDTALRYIDDLHQTLTIVEALTAGREPVSGIGGLLARMASAGRCRRASLLVPGRRGALRTVATLTRDPDVFVCHPRGAQIVARHLLFLSSFAANDPETPDELRATLAAASPPVHGLASVPLRGTGGVHGVFLLYYGPTEAILSREELGHLGWMGRGLSASQLAKRAHDRAREAEGQSRTLRAVEVALRAFARVDLQDGLAAAVLAGAARALATGRIETRTDSLDLVLDALRESGIQAVGEPTLVLHGDACLLRLALEALVELTLESGAGPARVSARAEAGHVAISIWGRGVITSPPSGDGRWLLAQRVAELHSAELTSSAAPDRPAFSLRFPSGGE